MRLRTLVALSLIASITFAPAGVAHGSGHVETVVSFDAAAGELPEGVAVDKRGNVFVSLVAPVAQIQKIEPDGTRSVLAGFDPGPFGGFGPLGLAVDAPGNVYAGVVTFDPATQGVYRVTRDGTATRLPGSEAIGFANGLAFDKRGNLYVTDTPSGSVWRIPKGGSAEPWIQDPSLEGTGEFGVGFPVGANGIAVRHDTVIVGNTEGASLVAIPILPDGSAGQPSVIAQDPALFGADGLALDVHGGIYVAVIAQSTIVKVEGGSITTIADASDGINEASSLAFGTGRGERQSLFAVNFGIFTPTPTPALLKIGVGVPGMPVP